MKLRRRKFLYLAAAAVTLRLAPRYAWAQAYPTRPVRIIVGFPAGIAPDIVARVIGQALSDRLGQQFVIENRPGAGSNIGTEIVVRAPPDGYTLLLAVSSGAINATLYSNLGFNYVRDIAPVGMIGLGPFVMVVNPKLPTKNVPEFIAYAKANPGKINMASQGTGLASHLMGELFKMMAGVNLVHVPYAGNFTADLFSGQVQVAFVPITNVIEYMRDARLRPLAVTTATRVEFLPDVPAISEFLLAMMRLVGTALARRGGRPRQSSTSSTMRSTPLYEIPP
jgi:tripartite-type tricarboxylate transporter receptor subunit TctC